MNKWISGLAFFLTMLISNGAQAISNRITFKGTTIAPLSCVINGGKPISVDFGTTVITDRVNGVNYLKTIEYKIECTNNAMNALKMQISTPTTDFDTSAVKLNKPNIGIALYNGSNRLKANEWFNFTWPNYPVLKAVPVRRPDAPLQAGQFTGTATLMLEYQ